ncbi:hypothetical protein ACT2FY_09420 [Paraburkholderia fungorum]|uniref:hypothetical protein n=1 Tax=Paraburkholderia fungorum TaxID=134537 RepID=UPI00402B0DB7
MRKLLIPVLLAAATAAWAQSAQTDATSPAVQAPAAAPSIKNRLVGKIAPDGDKGRKLYVEFNESPALSKALQEAFKAQGYELADTKEQADIAYIFDGAFQAMRPATNRTAEIRLGEYAEHPEALKTKSRRGFSVALGLNPLAVVAGTVLQNVGNATGVQDAVNSAVGDPDGKCLAKCDQWGYKQRATVNIERYADGKRASVIASVSETTEDGLDPDGLILASLQGLSARLGLDLASAYKPRGRQ